jgi:chemosensory pili system protein ChpA (sensor histidine kinase/response regulator)
VALAGLSDEVVDQFIQDAELVAIMVEELADLMPEIQQLLEVIDTATPADIARLHRLVHTLKGSVGQVGALRARIVVHKMETVMEDLDEGRGRPAGVRNQLLEMLEAVHVLVRPLVSGEWANDVSAQAVSEDGTPAPVVVPVQPRASIKVAAEQVDRMILDVDQSRLAGLSQEEAALAVRQRLRELEEVAQRASLLLRELEIQSEIQMQSRQVASMDTVGFDPLELDRFTRLQELARLTGEGVADVLEVRRDLLRLLSRQDADRARAGRYMQGVATALHRARLIPADAIHDRMYNVVWLTARELGKDVAFELVGARVEVDRLLLEKILAPLDHVLRNSVAHGIESPDARVRAGKPRQGQIRVTVRTAAGRAIIEVSDDGAGLATDRIRAKAVEKGLWPVDRPMTDADAAEMVCAPGFSTAEAVSQVAGRGVGMDAVRESVLGMGGRFAMSSRPGQGLDVFISIPTSVASASVLLVEDGGEPWALPIDVVEQVVLAPRALLDAAHQAGSLPPLASCPAGWEGTVFRRLSDLTGVSTSALPSPQSPLLLLREHGQTMALEVGHLTQVLEATLSPPGPVMAGVRGVAGALVLPSGTAALLMDPFRAPSLRTPAADASEPVAPTRPLVLVVDDSLTVRKAVIRFLGRQGYDHAQARDGQEALDLLERINPAAVVLDVEMPRLDGFACAQAIRENPRTAHLPIIMVTSRTAEKHQQRALDIGVNAYLGKPFKDADLAAALSRLISSS